MGDKELVKVTFEFEGGTEKVLEGSELHTWMAICLGQSDYLLPGAEDHVLARGFGGLVQGFVPEEATKTNPSWERILV